MNRSKNPNVIYWYDFVGQAAISNGWSEPQQDDFATKMCEALHLGKLQACDSYGFPTNAPNLPIPVRTVFVETDKAVSWMSSVGPFSWGSAPKPYMQKSLRQEEAILAIIKEGGKDPMSFPESKQGYHGTEKSKVRGEALNQKDLFSSRKVFDSAWERLRRDKKIKTAL